MKIIIFIGTRPEAIKLYPLIIELKKEKSFSIKICFTGQHDFLLHKVLKEIKIKPNFKLNCKSKDANLNLLTSKLYKKIDGVIKNYKPDLSIVQGDTTSSLVAAITSFHNKIKVAHIEAGLRTYNNQEPFPEEFNRKTISLISELNFAPTNNAKKNLLHEKIDKNKIYVTGNTIVDAVKILKKKYLFKKKDSKKFILVTCHRRENYKNFDILLKNLLLVVKKNNLRIVLITHPGILKYKKNSKNLTKIKKNKKIKIYSKLSYLETLQLIYQSHFVVSDSGGIQEEAPSFKKFILILRNYTERIESVNLKISKLIDFHKLSIFKNITYFSKKKNLFSKNISNPYGDGKAAKRIVKILLKWSQKKIS